MSVRKFFEELKGGLKAPAYLLYCEEAYLLKEALLTIKKAVPEAERDFHFHSFNFESPEQPVSVEQILDVLYTVPFLGGRQTVAVENAQKIPDREARKLAAYISKPSPDSVLVILNAGTLKKARREMLKGAKAFSLDIKERDFPFWIKEKASRKGLTLTSDAVQYLMGTIGPDAGLLSSEIEKLALSGRERLGARDIAEIVKGSGGYDVFDLVDALRAKQADRVFRIYRALSETQEPHSLLGALNWHYGRHSGKRAEKARIFSLLSEADFMIKSSGGAFPVEYLLVRLLQI
jgi:DNA polymerase III delta subunit